MKLITENNCFHEIFNFKLNILCYNNLQNCLITLKRLIKIACLYNWIFSSYTCCLKPLLTKASSYVRNSANFVELFKGLSILSSLMGSFDVVILWNETLHIFRDKLENDPGLRTRKITFNNLMNMLTSFVWV